MPDIKCRISNAGCLMSNINCRMFVMDVECHIYAVEYWM